MVTPTAMMPSIEARASTFFSAGTLRMSGMKTSAMTKATARKM